LAWDYIDLGYFLAVAEKVLRVPAERLRTVPGLIARADSALSAPKAGFSGKEHYPDFELKAAVLCARLIKNHPLPDGNKRVAFICMTEFIERNGLELVLGDDDGEVHAAFLVLVGVAANKVSEVELASWLSTRLRPRLRP
jgi:death-on-curing protein